MTCEIAVMNKWGVALAADSAVTLGGGRKVYNTAQKIFCLGGHAPVGVMTYGSAEIMGTPWEIIIKMYVRQAGGRTFEHLDQYASDFFAFVEGSRSLFPAELQKKWLISRVGGYWKNRFADRLPKPGERKKKGRDTETSLRSLLREDHSIWERYPPMERLGAKYSDRVIEESRPALLERAKEIFGSHELSHGVIDGLLKTAYLSCAKQWVDPEDRSGIVFAGMGEGEPFPRLLDYTVGTLTADTLRYFEASRAEINHNTSACVVPLAQRGTVDGFITGIQPELSKKLPEFFADAIRATGKSEPGHAELLKLLEGDDFGKSFYDRLYKEVDERFRGPLLDAVDALPRQDLGNMAETLVSLTAFHARMTADQVESVGGPVDVALISKGDGFVWMKQKRLGG